VVTLEAPSSIRNVLGQVTTFVFPALSVVEIGRWIRSWMSGPGFKIGRRFSTVGHLTLILLAFVPSCLVTARDYFVHWPQLETVRYVHQTALTAIGRQLDELPPETAVAVAGWSAHTLDRPTLELTTRRDVSEIRLCDLHEDRTLIVPTGRDSRLFVPSRIPFDEDLRQRLLTWGADVATDETGAFTSYRLSDRTVLERHLGLLEHEAALPDGSAVELPVSFGGHLAFLGYEWLQRDSDSLQLLTYWRVVEPPSSRLKIFVHLLDDTGDRVAQHDGLGSPPRGWMPGDLLVQKHVMTPSESLVCGLCRPQVGLYNASSGSRLSVAGVERLSLSSIEVKAR
jgi:hypothetical protein